MLILQHSHRLVISICRELRHRAGKYQEPLWAELRFISQACTGNKWRRIHVQTIFLRFPTPLTGNTGKLEPRCLCLPCVKDESRCFFSCEEIASVRGVALRHDSVTWHISVPGKEWAPPCLERLLTQVRDSQGLLQPATWVALFTGLYTMHAQSPPKLHFKPAQSLALLFVKVRHRISLLWFHKYFWLLD